MPKFKFDDFAPGSAVSISAVQGAQNAAGSVATWGQANLASVDILQVTPNELVAPVGIWFEAIEIAGFDVSGPGPGEVYDATAHGITWIWDFDDPGPFSAPLNIPTSWNEKSVDYGKKAYHVFNTPGTYNVRLSGTDRSGTPGERTVSVTILDPASVYAGNRTICVSQAGDFTGAPGGAQLVTSLSAAKSAAGALGQTGRILLRAGETFQEYFEIDSPMVNCRVGSFGAGAKPVLLPPNAAPGTNTVSCFLFKNGNTVTDSVFYGLRFQGDWDAATETGDPRGQGIAFTTHNSVDFNALIYQCEFDGMGAQYLDPLSSYPHLIAVVDCDVTNWQDYGLFVGSGLANYLPGKRFALVGTTVHQKIHACRGGQGKIGLTNAHGPLRYVDNMQVVISACDFYSANSWAVGVQPCIRLAQADDNNPGGYFLNINRIACEGGNIGGIDGQNDFAPERPGNHVIDKFLFVSDYSTDNGFLAAFGGTTLRNGLIARLNMAYQTATQHMLRFAADNPTPDNLTAPMDLYNLTFLNLDSNAVTSVVGGISTFPNHTNENIVVHEPDLANTPHAPIDLATPIAGFSTRNKGQRTSLEKPLVPIGTVGPGQSVSVPYPAGTSAADFTSGGRHTVRTNGNYYFSYRGDCSLSFGGSSITITNTSGDTWSTDIRLGLDQETLVTDTAYGSPATVPLPVPQTGSPARVNDGGYIALTNFLAAPRSGTWKGAV